MANLARAVVLALLVLCIYAADKQDIFSQFPVHEKVQSIVSAGRSINAANQFEDLRVQQIVKMNTESVEVPTTKDENKSMRAQLEEYYKYLHTPQEALFHTYNASATVIFGEADYDAMVSLLENQKYHPIRLHPSQKGIVSIWLLDNKKSTGGAFTSLEVYLHVSPVKDKRRLAVEHDNNPATLIFSLFGKLPEESRMYMLYNSATPAHDINEMMNNQIFGMKQHSIDAEKTTWVKNDNVQEFQFTGADGKKLLEGSINEQKKNSWSEYFTSSWQILKGLGLSGVLDLRDSKMVTLRIVSPNSNEARNLGQSTLLHVHTNFENVSFRNFDETDGDSIKLSNESELGRQLLQIGFQPKFVAHLPVYQDVQVLPSDQSEGA